MVVKINFNVVINMMYDLWDNVCEILVIIFLVSYDVMLVIIFLIFIMFL